MSTPSKIWILILTHNRSETLRTVLTMPAFERELRAYGEQARLFIQAQACSDDTWDWLKVWPQYAPLPAAQVKVRHIDFNLYAIGGRHAQIDWLKREGGLRAEDVVVFYDDDIRAVGSDWLTMFVEALAADASIGAVGIEGKTFKAGWCGSYGVVRGTAPVDVDVVGGGWMAVRGNVLLGGANYDLAQMPFWGGDDDFCLQIAALGYRVVCIGNQSDTGLCHTPTHRADDGDGFNESQRRLAAKWRGKGAALHERTEMHEAANKVLAAARGYLAHG